MRRFRTLLVVVALLPACTSGRDCALAIPEPLRADAIRFALDKRLADPTLFPQDDMSLALGLGKAYAQMTEERRQELARYATGYAMCLTNRIERFR